MTQTENIIDGIKGTGMTQMTEMTDLSGEATQFQLKPQNSTIMIYIKYKQK